MIGMVLAVLVGSFVLVVTTSAPAAACYCMTRGVAWSFDNADVVVTGALEEKVDPPRRTTMSSSDPALHRVEVEATYKGEPLDQLEFTSAMSGASCGLTGLQIDERYTFFLQRVDAEDSRLTAGRPGDLVAFLCGGTRPAADVVDARLEALAGPPVRPSEVAPVPTTPAADGVSEEGFSQWWLPMAGAVLTGLVALALLAQRRWTRS